MDGAVLEPRLSDERLALDQLERAHLLARDAERDDVACDGTLQFLGRALGDDLAVVDDRDTVAQRVRLVEVVRGEEHRGAALVHPPHLVPHAGWLCGSSPVVGSSRNRSFGPWTSPSPMSSRRFCPPEYVPVLRSAAPSSSSMSMSSTARFCAAAVDMP